MKRLLTSLSIALCLGWLLPVPASAMVFIVRLRGHNVFAVSSPNCAGDGLSGAPFGTPQFPTLMNGVAFHSGCAVAGVDYRTGPPENQVFALPSTLGANFDPTTHVFDCRQPGQVIDGIDFTNDGTGTNKTGGSIAGSSNFVDHPGTIACDGIIIQNSKMAGYWAPDGSNPGACKQAIQIDGRTALGVTLKNVEITGLGPVGSANCASAPNGDGEMISVSSSGALSGDYLYLHDTDQHFITWGGPIVGLQTSLNSTGVQTISLKHSLITSCGFQQGGHCNGMQFTGARTTSTDIEWNTFYDPQPSYAWTTEAGGAVCTAGSPNIVVTVRANQGSFRENTHLTSSCITGTALITGIIDPLGPQPAGPDFVTLILDRNANSSVTTTATVPDMWPIGMVIPIRYQNDGEIKATTGSVSGTTMTITVDNAFPFNFLFHVGDLIVRDNAASSIPAGVTIVSQLTSAESGGALGGRGTYQLSADVGTVVSGKISNYPNTPFGSITVSHNTFFGTGPVKGTTTAISCSVQTVGSTFTANGNYSAPADNSGLFKGDAAWIFTCGPSGRTGSGNIDMTSGATIPVP